MQIDYIHTIRVFETTVDGYGQHEITAYEDIPAVFEQKTGFVHSNYQDAVTSDAVALLDPTNEWVIDNANRLEEVLLVANPYDAIEQQSWYKVIDSAVGSYHQTSRDINTVQITLKKTRALDYAS